MNVKKKSTNVEKNSEPSRVVREEQPLLRVLVAEASRRGDTLAQLSKQLGVTYERLAQWRRGEGSIDKARGLVHELAAQYLGLPPVLAMVMAKKIGLMQFVWPAGAPLKDRVELELQRLRRDPFLGAFVPEELATATPALQLFVVFLFHELGGQGAQGGYACRWIEALHQAAVGDAQGQLELLRLREQETTRTAIF